ncbi:hypothetical protein D3C86_1511350 [compost metagenome]
MYDLGDEVGHIVGRVRGAHLRQDRFRRPAMILESPKRHAAHNQPAMHHARVKPDEQRLGLCQLAIDGVVAVLIPICAQPAVAGRRGASRVAKLSGQDREAIYQLHALESGPAQRIRILNLVQVAQDGLGRLVQ